MLCLVRQADSVILEIEVDPKAKGKQCIDKVCERLGIIESDYMGLQYTGPRGEKLWLNLRNQIRRQVPGPPPYRLQLRVKFYVPPHLILQDSTRYHFYLDIRQSFIENNFHTLSSHQICKLAALLAQVEVGDLDPTHTSITALLKYPKFLPSNCSLAAFSDESDRPRHLRVRWRSGGSNDSISSNSDDPVCDGGQEEQQHVSIETDRTAMNRVCQEIMKEHALLKGMKMNAAIYQFLKEVSELEDFGMEQYFVKDKNGETLRFSVGPSGILIHDLNLQLKQSITYASIHLATHSGRCMFLTFVGHSGEADTMGFKLENSDAANGLYRAVTEKHAFYSCETVRNAVTAQFIRDLKGTIASLFNDNTAVGKNYVFDIQRTCREVYDHTRRVMYQMEMDVKQNAKNCDSDSADFPGDCATDLFDGECHSTTCKIIQQQLATFQDSMLCRVCMDSDVGTVFFPCRHVACCSTCAPLCQSCPLCRSEISDTQHVYLPYSSQGELENFKRETTFKKETII
ncbi:E3 ubiquitin-protein ligase MYLIP-like [Uloborus diversus]|uniref:E3 ubiquitin-protein ligase MYLIP-like n=1 Tax=Uloborus diversus TaxID=327109 RepID=UPI0024091C91|nr:E3 ubiquitin-protein ligase MYLIP-like [Uloborus diversus]